MYAKIKMIVFLAELITDSLLNVAMTLSLLQDNTGQ